MKLSTSNYQDFLTVIGQFNSNKATVFFTSQPSNNFFLVDFITQDNEIVVEFVTSTAGEPSTFSTDFPHAVQIPGGVSIGV